MMRFLPLAEVRSVGALPVLVCAVDSPYRLVLGFPVYLVRVLRPFVVPPVRLLASLAPLAGHPPSRSLRHPHLPCRLG